MRHTFLVVTVKRWLKSVYIYGSYRKIKTGVPLFWTTRINIVRRLCRLSLWCTYTSNLIQGELRSSLLVSWLCEQRAVEDYYAAVLWTALHVLPVRLSVCLSILLWSVPYGLVIRKQKQESPAVADKPARRLRKVCTVYVRTVGL